MKRFICLLFALFEITAYSQTTIYHPFPDSNAVWNMNTGACCFSSCQPNNDPILEENWFSRFLNGDTVINNLTYAKMFESGSTHVHCPLSPLPNDWQFFNNNYAGCIRQDTALKQVYLLQPSATVECMLYDFNLSVGDTVPSDCFTASNIATVSFIDSVLIDGNYRKRFNLSCNGFASPYYIIEGIGSTTGHFEPFYCPLEQTGDLICFSQNGQPLYPDDSTSCANFTTIPEIQSHEAISVIPNPFSIEATIRLSDHFNPGKWMLFDGMGSKVREGIITGKIFRIGKENLASGIYVLQFLFEKETIGYKKLVIQ